MQYWDMASGEFCAQAGAVDDDIPGAVAAVLPDHLFVVAYWSSAAAVVIV
jgi:hypothetical protein